MTATITDIYHDGSSWVANIVFENGNVNELSITDAQAESLKNTGIKIYEG